MASCEVVWVAELDGRIAAAMAAFPVAEAARALARLPPARPARHPVLALAEPRCACTSAGGRASPKPRDDSFYVDALATDPALRRRGAARALLDEAEREARARSLPAVTLDTTMNNEARAGAVRARGIRRGGLPAPQRAGCPGFVALVRPVGR